MRRAMSVTLVGAGILYSSGAWGTTYSESASGDLSGNRLVPTPIVLTVGSNPITATSASGDLEYFRLTVPVGFRLSAINVTSSTSTSLSFIAVQRGDTFTTDPAGAAANPMLLLGWAHFGPGNGTVGTNILDDMGVGGGAAGFVPPLGAGNYTFWSQETSAVPSTYSLDFVVTASPAAVPIPRKSLAFLALGLATIGVVRLRRGSKWHRVNPRVLPRVLRGV
jgi:hypothetical protein